MLIDKVRAELAVEGDAATRLGKVCALLAEGVAHFDWVGFYLVDGGESRTLKLGPYVGAPTEHTRISFGEGVCGQAAAAGRTIEVPDVNDEGNYLACSLETRAEIVLPVFHEGRLVGELDIDSHTVDPFTPADRRLLEEVVRLCAPLVAELS